MSDAEPLGGRLIVATLTVAAILMVAGVVHIVSLLTMPRVAPEDAFARVEASGPEAVVRVLPRPAPQRGAGPEKAGDPLPGRDPAVATAICRYDLAAGPMRISAALGGQAFVALSLHSRTGVVFYGLNDRAGNDGRLELVVMTPAQLDAAKARDSEDSPVRDVRVVAPEPRGFVSFDVLPRIGGYEQAERDLGSMSCKVER